MNNLLIGLKTCEVFTKDPDVLAVLPATGLEQSIQSIPLPVRSCSPGSVVQKVDNAMHRINHYPVDSVVCFVNTYPLYSDLSSGLVLSTL